MIPHIYINDIARIRLAALACVLVAVVALGACDKDFSGRRAPRQETKTYNPQSSPDENSREMDATLKRIVDGDTIVLDGGEKVRYIGVNTPEIRHGKKPGQFYGPEAVDCNAEILGGRRGVPLHLVFDKKQRDRYGRLLAYVYAGEGFKTFVNMELAMRGCAEDMRVPPNVKYAEEFDEAAARAASVKKGMWADGGGWAELHEKRSRK